MPFNEDWKLSKRDLSIQGKVKIVQSSDYVNEKLALYDSKKFRDWNWCNQEPTNKKRTANLTIGKRT